MREITAIIYLNASSEAPPPPRVVTEGDGQPPAPGSLLLYPGAHPNDTTGVTAAHIVEIAPVGGRLVLFDSRAMLHEVVPHTNTQADRIALTLWFGGPHSLGSLCSDVRRACGRLYHELTA